MAKIIIFQNYDNKNVSAEYDIEYNNNNIYTTTYL